MKNSRILQVVFLVVSVLFTFIDLACGASTVSERAVLAEINLARSEPRLYAGFLKEFRSNFRGNFYGIPGMATVIETNEGVAAVDEAINFLVRQKSLPVLGWSAGLAVAAAELAREQEKSGATGHDGEKSGGISARIERNGIRGRMIGENIAYGPSSARGMVMQMIIDDGVSNRGHRKNQFNPIFDRAGVYCGSHPSYETMCVIDFCGGSRQ
ncbi:MAG: CAP domain-containing protein [Proteobacteria bacterium]|nr:CAP domain-containing protein [Pseudomonadota bacterium]